jgi:hypothetical protein
LFVPISLLPSQYLIPRFNAGISIVRSAPFRLEGGARFT